MIINVVFIIVLIGNMVCDFKVIKSNKERIRSNQSILDNQKEIIAKIQHNTLVQNARIEEIKSHIKKLDVVNRKLTILNKANYKKY